MKRYYTSHSITNPGELACDQLFDQSLRYDKEQWYVFHSFRIAKHRDQKVGECDFVLLSKYGILVLEVKGGLISYEGGQFWFEPRRPGERRQLFPHNPFEQVDGNAGSLIHFFKEKRVSCFIGYAVVFPQSTFNYSGISYENFWHLSHKDDFLTFVYKTLEFQKREAGWRSGILSEHDMIRIMQNLKPTVMPDRGFVHMKLTHEEVQRKIEGNIDILEGLRENRRLMIQGPPGSGKSKYAFMLVKRKLENRRNKGLYLCWNEFLSISIRDRVEKEGLAENLEVYPLFSFVKELIVKSGQPTGTLTFENFHEFHGILENTVALMEAENTLPRYDFIVCDEAQDLFDKGIDILINKMLNQGNKGIEFGEYLIFYDRIQAFRQTIDRDTYDLTYEYLKDNSAHYRLKDSYRAVAGEGIADFINDLSDGDIDLNTDFGSDVVIKKYAEVDDIVPLLEKTVRNLVQSTKCSPEDMVILFTSNLISGTGNQGKPLDDALQNSSFIKLTNENLLGLKDRTGYTTAIKYKGLEKEIVIVVVHDLNNQKYDNNYQLFMGATRTRSKLVVLVDG